MTWEFSSVGLNYTMTSVDMIRTAKLSEVKPTSL